MGNYWSVGLRDFFDESGAIAELAPRRATAQPGSNFSATPFMQ